MSTKADRNVIKKIVNLLVMPKEKFRPQKHFDKLGRITKVPTPSGEHIAIKLTNAKEPLPGNPVLLFAHGDGETIEDYYTYQSYFIKHGVSFCIMDHRGVGYGEGQYQTSGIRETEDCLTVIEYLKKNGFEKISFFGRSLGGICGIYLASRYPDLVCLALDSPVIDLTEYVIYFMGKAHHVSSEKVKKIFPLACEQIKEKTGIDFLSIEQPSEAAKKITQPIFVIHGKSDIHVPISNSEKLMELVQSEDKTFEPFNGTHNSFRYQPYIDLFLFILQHNGEQITEFADGDADDDEIIPSDDDEDGEENLA